MMNFSDVKDLFSIYLMRSALKVFFILPIKTDKIFFTSYEGKQFSCNPKSIFLELKEHKELKIKYVYEYNNSILPEPLKIDTTVVTHNSLAYIIEILTSKVVITNSGITAKLPMRKSQVVINTWHAGGAYKKGGKDISEEINGSGKTAIYISEKQTTYFISSSQRFTEIIHSALGINSEKMLDYGLPRNDIFFMDKNNDKHNEIKTLYNIAKNKKLVLYAPTYRGNVGSVNKDPYDLLDTNLLKKALAIRFGGEWDLLYRGHYFNQNCYKMKEAINVSDYPDMQELLNQIDVMITDYSSSIWDFSFTDKPAFLFTPDVEEYIDRVNFYTPIDNWPYKKAESNQKLYNIILNYDSNKQIESNNLHHNEFNSFEKGTATKNIVKLVVEIIMEELR